MKWMALTAVQWVIGLLLVFDAGPFRGPLARGMMLAGIFVAIDWAKWRAAASGADRGDRLALLVVHAIGVVGQLMHSPLPALALLLNIIVDPLVRFRLWTAYAPSHLDRTLVRQRLLNAIPFALIGCGLSGWWAWTSNDLGSPVLAVAAATLAAVSWTLGLSVTRDAFGRFYGRAVPAIIDSAHAE